MILVDTSVLIGYFRGQTGPIIDQFEDIMTREIPFGINSYIFQEVLQGAKDNREFSKLKTYLEPLIFYEFLDNKTSHEQAARLYMRCRQSGITIRSTLDVIIAQCAIEHQLLLLHNDKDFDAIAKVIPELKLY